MCCQADKIHSRRLCGQDLSPFYADVHAQDPVKSLAAVIGASSLHTPISHVQHHAKDERFESHYQLGRGVLCHNDPIWLDQRVSLTPVSLKQMRMLIEPQLDQLVVHDSSFRPRTEYCNHRGGEGRSRDSGRFLPGCRIGRWQHSQFHCDDLVQSILCQVDSIQIITLLLYDHMHI